MALSITPQLIIAAADKRGWLTEVIDDNYNFYRITTETGQAYYIQNITSIKSDGVNKYITDRKDLFSELMKQLEVTTPATLINGSPQAMQHFLAVHERIVVKPTNEAHGKGITLDITTPEKLEEALRYAATYGTKTLLQQQITGDDHRLLFIGGELAAAAIRKPAYVVGDGKHTVEQLIALENESERRQDGYQSLLTTIDVASSKRYLGDALQAVPIIDEEVRVVGVANIGRGGVAIDVTDTISKDLVKTAKTVIDHFDMGLCGIDFMVTGTGEAYLIEINAGPSLGLHEFPFSGQARGTQDKFLDWLVA